MRVFKRATTLMVMLLFCIGLLACAMHIANSGSDDPAQKEPGALRLASYNVHYIWLDRQSGAWSVGDWDRRKAPLDAAFKSLDADIVAFQEMESFARGQGKETNLTLDYLLEQNPDYRAAAQGDPAVFPSTQPIFYKADALKLIDEGWFFFSDTPDVIYSRTFNGSFPAFCSWARFERADGQRFQIFNVHFEYSSGSNRLLSAELVKKRMLGAVAQGEDVFLVGDLNARLGSETVGILESAGLDFAPTEGSTYHFNLGINLFGAIDHIAHKGPGALAKMPMVVREKFLDEWPTDHYPVSADYYLGSSRPNGT